MVQEPFLARSVAALQDITRRAARALTGADGATFVLRDDDKCFDADGDAIAPLWKGLRFPLESFISGCSKFNRQAVVTEDIYADARIPHEAYRPTFVRVWPWCRSGPPIRSAPGRGSDRPPTLGHRRADRPGQPAGVPRPGRRGPLGRR